MKWNKIQKHNWKKLKNQIPERCERDFKREASEIYPSGSHKSFKKTRDLTFD